MYNTLGQKLRHASQKCFEDGKLSEDEKHKYFMSVTEEEILTGLLKLPGNISEQCMCFVRIFENIDLNDKVAPRFIDMLQDKTIDEEAQKILQLLRDEKVANKINNKETNFSRYSIVYCIWCTLVNVCLANFQYFGFERTWWRLFRLSVPDEGYSRNLSCALNLISTFKGAHTGIVFEQYKSDVLLESRLLTGQRPPPNNQWKTLRLSVYVTLHLQKPWRWPVLTKTTDNFLFYHLVTAAKNKRGLH